MIDSRIFLGLPINFDDICKVYPVTVKDMLSNEEIKKYSSILCQSNDDIQDILEDAKVSNLKKIPTCFEFMMANAYNNINYKNLLERGIKFFTKEHEVYILPEQGMIYLGNQENLNKITDIKQIKCINADNFLDFQNIIRQTVGLEVETPEPESNNPIVQRIRRATRRRKRAAKKNKNNENQYTNITFLLSAVCCMNIGLNPLNIGNLPYAALNVLISTFQRKEKYDIDIQTICGGADPKKVKPKYWIKPDKNNVIVPIDGIKAS